MPRRRRNRKTLRGNRKDAAQRRRPGRLVFGIGLLLVIGVIAGVLVFQGRDEGRVGARPLSVLRTADYHSLAFSPSDPNVVFFGHHNGVMRSDDGGKTWRRLADRRNLDAMAMAIDPEDSRLVYLAGHDVFQVSQDGGGAWKPVEHDLPGTDIHGFTISPEDPRRLFAFVVGYGLFRSSDGGHAWVRLSAELPADVVALATSGGDPEVLYIASIRNGVFRSSDGGQSWAPAAKGLGPSGVVAIAVSPEPSKTVYAGGDTGLSTSTDGGNSWTKLPFPGRNVAVLALSPAQPGLLMAITVVGGEGLVYRSEDGGKSWGN